MRDAPFPGVDFALLQQLCTPYDLIRGGRLLEKHCTTRSLCMRRCFGATSWQPCFGVRGHRHSCPKLRGQHTVIATAEQQTVTAEVPKTNKQQQKKQLGQKNSKNPGGKDKKSELAITPKSEDFAR